MHGSFELNRSGWRLTWVGIIFLPLTFVAGLMGMNVGILHDNPSWYWYVHQL